MCAECSSRGGRRRCELDVALALSWGRLGGRARRPGDPRKGATQACDGGGAAADAAAVPSAALRGVRLVSLARSSPAQPTRDGTPPGRRACRAAAAVRRERRRHLRGRWRDAVPRAGSVTVVQGAPLADSAEALRRRLASLACRRRCGAARLLPCPAAPRCCPAAVPRCPASAAPERSRAPLGHNTMRRRRRAPLLMLACMQAGCPSATAGGRRVQQQQRSSRQRVHATAAAGELSAAAARGVREGGGASPLARSASAPRASSPARPAQA